MTRTFEPFATWAEVCAQAKAAKVLYYHAPLDARPVWVRVEPRKGNKVRVFPCSRDADAFTADAGHLDRFRRLVTT